MFYTIFLIIKEKINLFKKKKNYELNECTFNIKIPIGNWNGYHTSSV